PTFTERTISGTARVQNNRTMMLASVSTEVQSNGRQGLPFLSGLPILGRLFTSPTKENRQVDIVIAVTPRVLRAPAVTPRDELMRPSGTLQSPTTGSLEAMLRETDVEEQQIAAAAAARSAKRTPTAPLPDPTTYVPAANTAEQTAASNNQTAMVASVLDVKDKVSPAVQPAAQTTASNNGSQADNSMPQPKAVGLTTPQTDSNTTKTLDVATALKNVVSPQTSVSTTSDNANKTPTITTAAEDLAPKSPATDVPAANKEPLPRVIELRLSPAKYKLSVGEKRQLAIELSSEARLGLAV